MDKYQTFYLEKFNFSRENKQADLHYSLDGKVFFCEKIIFQHDFIENYSEKALEKSLELLWITAGMSYFKTYLPGKIAVRDKNFKSSFPRKFLTEIYQTCLGEFFFTNNINPAGKINFSQENFLDNPNTQSFEIKENNEIILPLGGGKDSLVSAYLLHKNKQKFTPWIVNNSEILQPQTDKLSEHFTTPSPLKIIRKIDKKLLEINKQDALNGHVSVSSILMMISLCSAILLGKNKIFWSNEKSASEGNIKFHDYEINHQASKSLEFEEALQKNVQQFIAPNLIIKSYLRNYNELQIAEIFAKNIWNKFIGNFSSCNRNFHLVKKSQQLSWCGKCPKCAFVALIFAPFLSKKDLLKIFAGKNIFLEKSLQSTFHALAGIEGHKPLECVGSLSETLEAINICKKKSDYKSDFSQLFPGL
jgi:hypothetical protein